MLRTFLNAILFSIPSDLYNKHKKIVSNFLAKSQHNVILQKKNHFIHSTFLSLFWGGGERLLLHILYLSR